MRQKEKDPNKLSQCHYSTIQNIFYCLKNTVHCYFPLLYWCLIAILANVTLQVLSTYLPKAVIEKITDGNSLLELVMIVLAFMGCIAMLSGIGKFFTKFIYHQKFRMNTFYLKRVALKGLTTDYSNQENGIFRKLQTESFACCNGNYSPLTNIYDVLINLCTSVLGLSVFWAILAQLNLFVILFLIVTTVIGYFLNQKIMKWTDKNSHERIGYEQRLNYINTISGDIRSAKDIRMYRMSGWLSDLYKENMNGIIGWYRRLTSKIFGVAVCDSGLSLLRESITYFYLIYLVWNHQISVADFVLYFGVVTGFSAWLSSIFSQVSLLNQLNLKINYFRSYLEYPESFRRHNGVKNPKDEFPRCIELKNVSYRYEGADRFALNNINLRIIPGEHLAIVGLNGAGKTTLVKLICGLIDPTSGQVLYDGVDIREYNRTELYKLFSAVFQQFSILPVTVEEIVAETPVENLNHDKVTDCLKTAGLWNKIEQLPEGVKSQFGKIIYDNGVEFSGGEVQKLLLARALYKAAPIVTLFLSKSGNTMIDNPIWIIVILLCILLGGFSNSRATVKENKVFMKWCEDTVWFNRTFMFFGRELYMNPEKAKDVRIYKQNAIAAKALDKLIQTDKENQLDIFKMSIFPAIACVIIGLANAVCYLFVAIKAYFGAFCVGSVVQYIAVLQRLGDGLQELMFILSDNEVYCLHLQKLFDYLDIPNHMYQGSLTVEKRDDNEYYVEFHNVSFRYPNTDHDVLKRVNIKFKVGEKLAVVGMNGSGKSTFIKLLCRLYDPTEGEILLNGVDVRKYNYDEYRSIFSVVFQDFKLFSFSLGQNVAASLTYDKERVYTCLEKAGFGARVQEMPEGCETCLYQDFEENGVGISGGEAQKIALARALYKDATFIVLDEPTAALDPITEYEVYSKFNEIVGDKTTIYISHRLSSCRFCDNIAVFHDGQIVQKGSHGELVSDEKGKYYELWSAQAQYYAEEKA